MTGGAAIPPRAPLNFWRLPAVPAAVVVAGFAEVRTVVVGLAAAVVVTGFAEDTGLVGVTAEKSHVRRSSQPVMVPRPRLTGRSCLAGSGLDGRSLGQSRRGARANSSRGRRRRGLGSARGRSRCRCSDGSGARQVRVDGSGDESIVGTSVRDGGQDVARVESSTL